MCRMCVDTLAQICLQEKVFEGSRLPILGLPEAFLWVQRPARFLNYTSLTSNALSATLSCLKQPLFSTFSLLCGAVCHIHTNKKQMTSPTDKNGL